MNEQYYVEFIRKVWQGSIYADTSQINGDVVTTANKVFLEIQKCSRAFLGTDVIFSLFYTATSLSDVIGNIVSGAITGTITGWVDALMGSTQYRTCVLSAATKWKSVMALALLGLARRSQGEITAYLKEHPELGLTDDKAIREVAAMMEQVSAAE